MDQVTAKGSISVFRVSTGEHIETSLSPSPASTVSMHSLEIWDAPTQPIPTFHNPIPKMIEMGEHLDKSHIEYDG